MLFGERGVVFCNIWTLNSSNVLLKNVTSHTKRILTDLEC